MPTADYPPGGPDLWSQARRLHEMYEPGSNRVEHISDIIRRAVSRSLDLYVGRLATPQAVAEVGQAVLGVLGDLQRSYGIHVERDSVVVGIGVDGRMTIQMCLNDAGRGSSTQISIAAGESTPGVVSTRPNYSETMTPYSETAMPRIPTGVITIRPSQMVTPHFITPQGDIICHMQFVDGDMATHHLFFKTNRFKVVEMLPTKWNSEIVYNRDRWDQVRSRYIQGGIAMPTNYPDQPNPTISQVSSQIEVMAREAANSFMWNDDVPPLEPEPPKKLKRTFNLD